MRTLILNRPVIAVAGSSGKTTTKEMIASILSRRWLIFKSAGNHNNRHATARHMKMIRPAHRAVVLEFGMSYSGHLTKHCRMIKPNMAVVTMVGNAHIGNFGGSLDRLIRAKSEIISHMQPSGTLFLNADDANSRQMHTAGFKGKIVKVSLNGHGDYNANRIHYTRTGMSFSCMVDGVEHVFRIPVYGRHNVYNALFAIAVARQLGFSPEDIRRGLKNYRNPGRRLMVYRPGQGVKVIDDTFNANPLAVKAAIDVLSHAGGGRNIAVLGSMLELGRQSPEGHRQVGRYVARRRVDYLYTFGQKAKQISDAAVASGFSGSRARHFVSREALHRELIGKIGPRTTVLIKGSNEMRMIETVRFLRRSVKRRPGSE